MQFFTKYGTDDKVHTTVWLPERKICILNALWSTSPNMYSIRGDLFRDAREWAELMKNQEIEMRRGTAEEAEHLIGLFDKYRPEKALLVAAHLHD